MAELISLSIFFISAVGIFVIVLRKAPVLSRMPAERINREKIISAIKYKAMKDFSVELFLQKFLSKSRVVVLKVENKIGHWLNRLRQKDIERKNSFTEDYWTKLKK